MKTKRWYRLDNSAKIFPPIINDYDTGVFRVSCTLKEKIIGNFLQEAMERTLVDFPIFNSALRKGFFWYYIEEVEYIPKVNIESNAPCDNIFGILYRISYFKNRINLEVHHALTDASGATMFLKALVAHYIQIAYRIDSKEEIDKSSIFEKTEDAFKRYYKNFKIHKSKNIGRSYKIKGQQYDDYRVKFIEGKVNIDKVISKAKENGCTISEYLTSVLILAIQKQMTERDKKHSIFVTVPISLRKEFPTNTIRNFFCTCSIKYKCSENADFETILHTVKEQYKKILERDNLYSKMSEMIFLESFFICRIVPRFIKDLVLKTSFNISRKTHTMTFSNIGRIQMPEEYNKYIQEFGFMSSTDGMQLNVCSFLNVGKLSFCSHFINTEIQMNFFRYLVSEGIDVSIDTNLLEVEELIIKD